VTRDCFLNKNTLASLATYATLSLFSERGECFLNKNTLRYTSLQKYKKIWYYILLLPYVRFAHIINNRSIAPIKASFIVSLDRLLVIAYCITNPAVIK
jgi:hypothetical protein